MSIIHIYIIYIYICLYNSKLITSFTYPFVYTVYITHNITRIHTHVPISIHIYEYIYVYLYMIIVISIYKHKYIYIPLQGQKPKPTPILILSILQSYIFTHITLHKQFHNGHIQQVETFHIESFTYNKIHRHSCDIYTDQKIYISS